MAMGNPFDNTWYAGKYHVHPQKEYVAVSDKGPGWYRSINTGKYKYENIINDPNTGEIKGANDSLIAAGMPAMYTTQLKNGVWQGAINPEYEKYAAQNKIALGTGKDAYWGIGSYTSSDPATKLKLGKYTQDLAKADLNGILAISPDLKAVADAYRPVAEKFIEAKAGQGQPTYMANSRTGQGANTPDEVLEQWLRMVALQKGSAAYGLPEKSLQELQPYIEPEGDRGFIPFVSHYGEESTSWIDKNLPYILTGLSLVGLGPAGLIGNAVGGGAVGAAVGNAAISAAMGGNPLQAALGGYIGAGGIDKLTNGNSILNAGLGAAATGGNPLQAALGAYANTQLTKGQQPQTNDTNTSTAGGNNMGGINLSNLISGNGSAGLNLNNVLGSVATAYMSNPDSWQTALAAGLGQTLAPGLIENLGLTGTAKDAVSGALNSWLTNRQYNLSGKDGALYGALESVLPKGNTNTLTGGALQGYLNGLKYGVDPEKAMYAGALGIELTPQLAAGTQGGGLMDTLNGLLGGAGGLLGGGGGGLLGGGLGSILPLLGLTGAFGGDNENPAPAPVNPIPQAATTTTTMTGTQAPAAPSTQNLADIYNSLQSAVDYQNKKSLTDSTNNFNENMARRGMLQSGFANQDLRRLTQDIEDSRAAASEANRLNVANFGENAQMNRLNFDETQRFNDLNFGEGVRRFDTSVNQWNTDRADKQSLANQEARSQLVSALLPFLFPQGPGTVINNLTGNQGGGQTQTAAPATQAPASTTGGGINLGQMISNAFAPQTTAPTGQTGLISQMGNYDYGGFTNPTTANSWLTNLQTGLQNMNDQVYGRTSAPSGQTRLTTPGYFTPGQQETIKNVYGETKGNSLTAWNPQYGWVF